MSCRHRRDIEPELLTGYTPTPTPAPVVEAAKCTVLLGSTPVPLPALVEAFIYTACALHVIAHAPVDSQGVAEIALGIARDTLGCAPWLADEALTRTMQELNNAAEETWDDSKE